jgi:hypothetical protein
VLSDVPDSRPSTLRNNINKLVLHLFKAKPAALMTVPTLAGRLHAANEAGKPALEVFIFGPAERALSSPDQAEFNAQIDGLVGSGIRVTTCTGLAQQAGAEAAFLARGLAMESAAIAFPRFAAEGATVITF